MGSKLDDFRCLFQRPFAILALLDLHRGLGTWKSSPRNFGPDAGFSLGLLGCVFFLFEEILEVCLVTEGDLRHTSR